jgi:hypothetical protein
MLESKKKINELVAALLKVHRHFLENERREAERRLERQLGPLDFFHFLTQDPESQWMKPFSGLITDIDERSSPKVPTTEADVAAMKKQVKRVLLDEESRLKERYDHYLQTDGAFAILHIALDKILKT